MVLRDRLCSLFFFNDTATTEIYTLSLHDALPIYALQGDSEHPVHLAVRLSRLKEANALVVGVTHQPGKSVLSQIALYLAAEAACAKGEAGHIHSFFS